MQASRTRPYFFLVWSGSLNLSLESVDDSSHCELLCYLIDAIEIERDVPSDLLYGRKRLLVRPHRIDGLLFSSRNAVVTAVAFVRTVGCVIRPLQLGKIHILAWNIFNRRIRRFAERQGVAGIGNHSARHGYDNASRIGLDGNRMIRTWKFDLLCFHVQAPPFALIQ